MVLSEFFEVEGALTAGFFDEIVEPAELMLQAEARAATAQGLDPRAHAASKRRIRAALVHKIRWSIPLDLMDAALMGLRGAKPRQ